MTGMTREELLALPVTVDLTTAARALGVGKSGAYTAAAAGTFPVRVLRLGTRWRVVTEDLLEVLAITRESSEAGPTEGPATARTDHPPKGVTRDGATAHVRALRP